METKQDEEEELVKAHTWNPDERKWRGTDIEIGYETWKEEKMTQIRNNRHQGPQISPKIRSIGPKHTEISL